MTNGKFASRNEKAESEPMIMCRTEEGFRVYSASQPKTSYVVSSTHEAPVCTCLDFQYHEGDPGWRCNHIIAVLNSLNRRTVESVDEVEERLAIQSEGALPEKKSERTEANGLAQMLIKRSVSPDGRIDSLSVEFSCAVDNTSVGEIRAKAAKTLHLQSEIVATFLKVNRKEDNRTSEKANDASPLIKAKLLDIDGIDGRWGRRLFINVQANGRTLKLFGNRKQLAEHITAAGFWNMADQITEGKRLNLPCRIITKPSDDGRWLNIEQVLPPEKYAGRSTG